MFAQERLNIIKSYLRENGKLDVHGISVLLGVSEVTIRRDLEKLEADGHLKRTHGGAILAGQDEDEESLRLRPQSSDGEVADIARVAARLVDNQDIIFLLDGACSLELSRNLAEKSGVTVLTNSIGIAREIGRQKNNRAVLLGGTIEPDQDALYGTLTHQNLKRFHVRRIFCEVDGISDELLVTFNYETRAALVTDAISCAEELVLMCPASRFSRKSFYRLGPVSMARSLITNPSTDENFKSRIFAMGIQLFTSVNAFEVPD